MINEGKAGKLMRMLGITLRPIPDVNKVLIIMNDGSYYQFDDPTVSKMSNSLAGYGAAIWQIKGEPREVDCPSAFKCFFGSELGTD
jgi:NACalpha-BTF3-like transcription factor